ncbi:hypothetical protein LJ656_17130 [Paraburkholderia sp. MMS20-SJTR3]|uniref:Uncharacterized protein n=1 Tax=Paraburkholderia sejongensis TaxID=2886946 RepID=A0ABS8JWN5_9BURK|nr:hypothetical protein [Paraburkholderia sp. MMS20-SJTR3]MCC8394322.1 hypothetical protein [Paraburkholderia sp. MMS20-SJTR3]
MVLEREDVKGAGRAESGADAGSVKTTRCGAGATRAGIRNAAARPGEKRRRAASHYAVSAQCAGRENRNFLAYLQQKSRGLSRGFK